MASKRLSKHGVRFHFICRHTARTSIRSSNYFPSSKRCCGRLLHIPSRTPPSPSTACARPSPLVLVRSPALNVPHSSPIQAMVNLIGKRSSFGQRTPAGTQSRAAVEIPEQRLDLRERKSCLLGKAQHFDGANHVGVI